MCAEKVCNRKCLECVYVRVCLFVTRVCVCVCVCVPSVMSVDVFVGMLFITSEFGYLQEYVFFSVNE